MDREQQTLGLTFPARLAAFIGLAVRARSATLFGLDAEAQGEASEALRRWGIPLAGPAADRDAEAVEWPAVAFETAGRAGLVITMAADPPWPEGSCVRLGGADTQPGWLGASSAPGIGVRTAATSEHPGTIGPDEGTALWILAKARAASRALDIGAGPGAAAVWLADALRQGGRLTAIERDSAARTTALRRLRAAGLADRAEVVAGEAERVLRKLGAGFEVIVLDTPPADRPGHIEPALALAAPSALIVSLGAANLPELATSQAVLRSHPRIRAAMTLPVGRGLMLAVVEG